MIYFDIVTPLQVSLYVIERSGPAASSAPGQLLATDAIATVVEQQAIGFAIDNLPVAIGQENISNATADSNAEIGTAMVGQ